MNMNKIGMDLLRNAKAAESTLKREERQTLGDKLPTGHPLLEDFESVKGEDLDGLPENHPLIVKMKAAKERYEQAQENKDEESQQNKDNSDRKIRKAKKVNRANARRNQIVKEETDSKELRDSASEVNKQVEAALNISEALYKVLEQNEDTLSRDRMNAARTVRLKRLLVAFKRGLSNTKMNRM